MGFRLSKRLKILPGVTLNLSKSGVSVSAGVRGAKVTVGKNGVRQTVGLPGTGLSHTTYTKHGNNSAPRASYSQSSGQPQTNITSSGVLLVFGLLLLILLATTKPSLIPVLVVASVIYFAWKKYNKPDAGIEQQEQSQFVSLPQSEKNTIEESARSMVRVVNESLTIANESENYDKRVSKTQVAKDTLSKLKELSSLHPGISLTSLDGVMHSIEDVERATEKIKSPSTFAAPLPMNIGSDNDRVFFEESTENIMRIINESIEISKTTKNPETKKSRISVAKQKINELRILMGQYPTYSVENLPYIQHIINSLEGDLMENREVATITAFDVDPSLTKLYEATENKPEGIFWADHIKTLKDNPKERLKYALKMKPLPAAFREAAIAYRALIKQSKKENTDHSKLLYDLYVLLAQESFLYEAPYIEEIKMPGYNVASSISKRTIYGLQMPYNEIGYEHLRAQKTDVKWFVDAWGEPKKHQKVQEYHSDVWRDALNKYINKLPAYRKKQIEAPAKYF